jgi:hypothetical protein
METYGDLKKVIKSVSLKQKGEKIGKVAIDTVLGAIPGMGAAKTSFEFFRAAFQKPDDKKTSSWLDKLDVDDEMSAIVDDTVENGFLKAIAAAIEKKPDDEKLDQNFDMNQKMTKYLGDKYSGRTVTGIKENKRIMKKSQLKYLIKETIVSTLEQEESGEKKSITIPSQLKTLIKELDPNINIQVLSTILAKVAQGKEGSLNVKENQLLAEVFIALMKNSDIALGQKFLSIFKQIK